MKILAHLLVIVALALPVAAYAGPKDAKESIATFLVDGLAKADFVKKVTKSLNGVAGVKAAKPDAAAGKLQVLFDPAKTDADALLKKLQTVAPGAKVDAPAPDAGQAAQPGKAPAPVFRPGGQEGGCGGCPFKNSCGGH